MQLFSFLNSIYDRYSTPKYMHRYEQITVFLALITFLGHISLIFMSRLGIAAVPFINGNSYLSSIQTPFTVVLYYEVFLLILALARPLSVAIGKQFEIATLLIIREVFKYLSQLESRVDEFSVLEMIGGSLLASVVAFALVGVFYFLKHSQNAAFGSDSNIKFISIKKNISVVIGVYMILLVGYDILIVLFSGLTSLLIGQTIPISVVFDHYSDILITMIFADVVIFIVSLLYLSAYRHVFIESALIIATVLIRLSLTFKYPTNVLLNVGAIAFGVMMLYVYSYFSKYSLGSEED